MIKAQTPQFDLLIEGTPIKRYVAALLSVLLLFFVDISHAFADPDLRVGIFPRRDAGTTIKLFKPLEAYLTAQLGLEVQIETARDFRAFERELNAGTYDLVHLNQYQYVQTHEQVGYNAVAQNSEFGETTIRGAIYVHNDSEVQELDDLAGKTVLFGGGPTAQMSFIVPTYLLMQAGLDGEDYQVRFAKSPPDAVLATYLGRADAAGAGEVVYRLPFVQNKIDTTQLRLLAVSEPLAQLPWAVHPRLDTSLVESIQQSLVGLTQSPSGAEVLKAARLTGIVGADDRDYDPHRRIISEVEGRAPTQDR